MTIEVLCIGHAAYDVSVFLDGYPQEDSKSETYEWLEACGGPAANAAYLLSSWGLRCAFAGLAGDDVHGRRARQELQSVGTDVSRFELREGHATPLSLILISKRNGSRTIVNRKVKGAAFQCRHQRILPAHPALRWSRARGLTRRARRLSRCDLDTRRRLMAAGHGCPRGRSSLPRRVRALRFAGDETRRLAQRGNTPRVPGAAPRDVPHEDHRHARRERSDLRRRRRLSTHARFPC